MSRAKENLIRHEDIYSNSNDLEAYRFTDITLDSRLQSAEENKNINKSTIIYDSNKCCDEVCVSYYYLLLKINLAIGVIGIIIYLIVKLT